MTQDGRSATVNIGQLIVSSPEIREGRPRIAGTGITVQRIVGWCKLGLSPEEVADKLGNVNLAQAHAALACYHANREQVEAALAADEAEGDRLEKRLEPKRKGTDTLRRRSAHAGSMW